MTDRHIKRWNIEESRAPVLFEDGCGCVSEVKQVKLGRIIRDNREDRIEREDQPR